MSTSPVDDVFSRTPSLTNQISLDGMPISLPKTGSLLTICSPCLGHVASRNGGTTVDIANTYEN